MAEIPGKDRAALKSDIALSRERMGRELSGLRYELDFPRKLKNSFRHSPAVWIGALAVLGILIAVAPARTKKVYVRPKLRWPGGGNKEQGKNLLEAGALVGVLKFAATMLRPMLVKFVATKVRDYTRGRGSAARPV
jgi:hypothetical protein